VRGFTQQDKASISDPLQERVEVASLVQREGQFADRADQFRRGRFMPIAVPYYHRHNLLSLPAAEWLSSLLPFGPERAYFVSGSVAVAIVALARPGSR